MSFTKEQLREQMLLYAVTDRHWLNGQTLYEQVEEALKGGATFIQKRQKRYNSYAKNIEFHS